MKKTTIIFKQINGKVKTEIKSEGFTTHENLGFLEVLKQSLLDNIKEKRNG
jgi:hypothetical protein